MASAVIISEGFGVSVLEGIMSRFMILVGMIASSGFKGIKLLNSFQWQGGYTLQSLACGIDNDSDTTDPNENALTLPLAEGLALSFILNEVKGKPKE